MTKSNTNKPCGDAYTTQDHHFYFTKSDDPKIEPMEGSTTDIKRCRLELGLKRHEFHIYHTVPAGGATEDGIEEDNRVMERTIFLPIKPIEKGHRQTVKSVKHTVKYAKEGK
jgi:hypothetical protein